ncbi:transporter [Marinobacter sp. HN1S83]|uniref:transporter n=1 Tax=Marinobacter sp. HN1S83 TaxID=3382301 RepID=UPI00387AC90D
MLRSTVTACLLAALYSSQANALQPRDYLPRPDGVSAMQFLYTSTSANSFYVDGEKAGDNLNLEQDIGVFLPVHYSTFMSMPTIFEAVIPFGRVSIDGADVGNNALSTSGLADPTFLAGIWPVSDNESQSWWAVAGWLTAPLGDYDNDQPLNLGRNQWSFKAQTGLAKGFGKLIVEVIPSVEVFSNNTDFSSASITLKRDPLYAVETHFSYDLTPSVLVSLDHFYLKGGESEASNTIVENELETHALQLTTRLAMAANQFLSLQYKKDISVENGSKTNTFSAQFTFGF